MANSIAPVAFNFNSHEVRTIQQDDVVWFVASDIAKSLNYAEAKDLVRVLDEDEQGRHIVPTPSGDQEMLIINESGLYHALFKSRKKEAQAFRKWVTSEVLPSIRKDGKYNSNNNEYKLQLTLAKKQAEEICKGLIPFLTQHLAKRGVTDFTAFQLSRLEQMEGYTTESIVARVKSK